MIRWIQSQHAHRNVGSRKNDLLWTLRDFKCLGSNSETSSGLPAIRFTSQATVFLTHGATVARAIRGSLCNFWRTSYLSRPQNLSPRMYFWRGVSSWNQQIQKRAPKLETSSCFERSNSTGGSKLRKNSNKKVSPIFRWFSRIFLAFSVLFPVVCPFWDLKKVRGFLGRLGFLVRYPTVSEKWFVFLLFPLR